ncbi:MAG: hypothetical protein Q7R97_01240 [Candidatus Daviesbacteria bacterium]|nr:hypothetical protein [Candidatus Daviesbacteria bacterium]
MIKVTFILMPTSQKFSASNFNQRGVIPIILIIIFTVVVAGVAGVAYQSRKEIKVRSDNTTEVTELKGTPEPTPKNAEVALANSGRLADKPFEQKLTKEASASSKPQFSMYPPAGWENVATTGNYVAEFLSSAKDKVAEHEIWLTVQPSISVNMMKVDYNNLDEAMEDGLRNKTNPNHTIVSKRKITVNGEEAYLVESVMDIGNTVRDILESQIQEELDKATMANKDAVEQEAREDIEKVLAKAKLRINSYVFYKDGYYIIVAGKSLESFWSSRGPQLKSSMDTFKFK